MSLVRSWTHRRSWTTREIAHVHAAPSTSTKHWQMLILIPMPNKENTRKPLASRKYQVGVSSPNPSSQNGARAQRETPGRNLCSLMKSPASISEPSGRGTVPVIQFFLVQLISLLQGLKSNG